MIKTSKLSNSNSTVLPPLDKDIYSSKDGVKKSKLNQNNSTDNIIS